MTAAPSASSRRRPDFTQINNHNHMKKLLYLFAAFLSLSATAQDTIYVPLTPRVYPTNWWVGMKYSKPELMIHRPDVGNAAAITVSYPGVTLADWHRAESPNYLFLHLEHRAHGKTRGI